MPKSYGFDAPQKRVEYHFFQAAFFENKNSGSLKNNYFHLKQGFLYHEL